MRPDKLSHGRCKTLNNIVETRCKATKHYPVAMAATILNRPCASSPYYSRLGKNFRPRGIARCARVEKAAHMKAKFHQRFAVQGLGP
jgi:hypothetical protein